MTGPRRAYLVYGLIGTIVVVAAAGAVVQVVPRLFKTCGPPPGADRVLSRLETDAILSFRAPGTTYSGSSSDKGKDCNVMGERTSETTTLSQGFSLTGDPATAVEAYVVHAQATGWQLRVMACDRSQRSMRVALTKDVAGKASHLAVIGADPFPPAQRHVFVQLTAIRYLDDPALDKTVNLHCIRPVKADDPGLRAFAVTATRTPAELCRLLSVAELQNRGLTVSRVMPEAERGVPVCRYMTTVAQGEGTLLVLRDASTIVPAIYEDLRLPTPAPGGDRLFFFSSQTSLDRDGVWITTARGPVLLELISETDDAVLALAEIVQGRAA